MDSEIDLSTGFVSDEIASPAVDFHEETGTYRTQFDVHTRPVSEAIVMAVAAATAKEPQELSPLYSVIDPEALDALFDAPPNCTSKQRLAITFEYADCRVSAKAHGTVVVDPGWKDS